MKVKVLVLINDTVGTLMSMAYKDSHTAIGLILGTGTNACYIEQVRKIDTVDMKAVSEGTNEMIVNTEWGAFGENGSIDFIRSRYDEEIDKTSINVGKQMFVFHKNKKNFLRKILKSIFCVDMLDSKKWFPVCTLVK